MIDRVRCSSRSPFVSIPTNNQYVEKQVIESTHPTTQPTRRTIRLYPELSRESVSPETVDAA
jgi:hypothetical protein